jgi:hypothetical protein
MQHVVPAALEALQHEAGLIYVPEKLKQGSTLMCMAWEHCEARIAEHFSAIAGLGDRSSQDTALGILQRRTCPHAESLRLHELPLLAGMKSNPIAMCMGVEPTECFVATGELHVCMIV